MAAVLRSHFPCSIPQPQRGTTKELPFWNELPFINLFSVAVLPEFYSFHKMLSTDLDILKGELGDRTNPQCNLASFHVGKAPFYFEAHPQIHSNIIMALAGIQTSMVCQQCYKFSTDRLGERMGLDTHCQFSLNPRVQPSLPGCGPCRTHLKAYCSFQGHTMWETAIPSFCLRRAVKLLSSLLCSSPNSCSLQSAVLPS